MDIVRLDKSNQCDRYFTKSTLTVHFSHIYPPPACQIIDIWYIIVNAGWLPASKFQIFFLDLVVPGWIRPAGFFIVAATNYSLFPTPQSWNPPIKKAK